MNMFKNTEEPYVWVDIGKIKPIVTDPINFELRKSLVKKGMLLPLILREGTNEIMFGNQRYAILKELNFTHLPVRYHVKEN